MLRKYEKSTSVFIYDKKRNRYGFNDIERSISENHVNAQVYNCFNVGEMVAAWAKIHPNLMEVRVDFSILQ